MQYEYTYDSPTEFHQYSLRRQQFTEETVMEKQTQLQEQTVTETQHDVDGNPKEVEVTRTVPVEVDVPVTRRVYHSTERLAVSPGEFDKVEEFAPSLLPIFQQIWKPGIIEAWQTKLAEWEANQPPFPKPNVNYIYELPVALGFTTTAKYRKDTNGEIAIFGDIISTEKISAGQTYTVAFLPKGFRPINDILVIIQASAPNQKIENVRISINADGSIVYPAPVNIPNGYNILTLDFTFQTS